MIAETLIAAVIAFSTPPVLAQAAPAKPNAAISASATPNDRARQWLTLVDDANYAQSWKEGSTGFRKRSADAWGKQAFALRDPLGAVASRDLKAIDLSRNQTATVSYDTSFARRTGAVETVTLTFENGGWAVADYNVK